MLTTFTTDDYVLRALNAGAAGFLLKNTSPTRIIEAVRQAAAGEPVMSPAALSQLIGTVTAAATEPTRQPASPPAVPASPAALEQLGPLGGREPQQPGPDRPPRLPGRPALRPAPNLVAERLRRVT